MSIWISCKPQTTRRSGQLDLAKPACSQREIKVIYFLFVIVLNNPQHVTRSGGYFLLHFFVHYMLYYTFLVCHRRQSAECSFNKPNCSNNNNDNSELAAELDRGLVAWYTWSRSSRKKSEKKKTSSWKFSTDFESISAELRMNMWSERLKSLRAG